MWPRASDEWQLLMAITVLLQGDASPTRESSPEEGPYWSLMFEVSESNLKPVNNAPTDLAGADPVFVMFPSCDPPM